MTSPLSTLSHLRQSQIDHQASFDEAFNLADYNACDFHEREEDRIEVQIEELIFQGAAGESSFWE